MISDTGELLQKMNLSSINMNGELKYFINKMELVRIAFGERKLLIVFLLLIVICFHSCSDRERLNPIDPQNPETGGRPQGLRVYSEYDQATLRWLNIGLDSFEGYYIYRKTLGDTAFQLIYITPPDSQVFIDKKLVYDQLYEYCITVKAEDFESLPSDTVSITPGPTFIWATDVFLRYIFKLTHDCSSVIERISVDGYPWALSPVTDAGEFWYTDVFLNRVYGVDRLQNQRIIDYLDTGEPIDLAMDEYHNQVWVADETRGRILVYNIQGVKTGEFNGFSNPYSLDSYQSNGTCWISDIGVDKIFNINAYGDTNVEIDSLYRPKCVSVNQKNGDCWVADSSRVLVYDIDGGLKLTIDEGLIYPLNVAVDSELGSCWVLDYSYFDFKSKLFCFSASGEKLVELSGFTQPENLIVNPYDHSCIVADSGSGKIFKISRLGQVIGESKNHAYPYGLVVEYVR